ncbi:MAG: hypothetical protein QNJ60_08295 [Xenococcaceae cyanobacterium MO_188.B19]|nr:hypothetical protein [Xenococcaceae cyanobacterium MO_188.B19]
MTQSAQKLQQFRNKAYQLLGLAKDATMDLMDAVLVTRNIYSFAELSLSPVFRRKWSSVYEALDDCRPNRQKLMKLYLREIPSNQRPIIAGDHTPWARTEAPTLKDRTYEHGAKVISGKPITFGHGYSTVAWIPEDKGSWALPLRHERITSFESPISKAYFSR